MKSQFDPRHKKRIKIVQILYGLSFSEFQPNLITDNLKETIADLLQKRGAIIEKIDKYTRSFSSEKMAKIDLSILVLALYELLYIKAEPPKVIVDEAIELAKEFGANASPKFINGILGKIIEENQNE